MLIPTEYVELKKPANLLGIGSSFRQKGVIYDVVEIAHNCKRMTCLTSSRPVRRVSVETDNRWFLERYRHTPWCD